MSFAESVESPYAVKVADKEIIFPVLTLRNVGVLIAKYKTILEENQNKKIKQEKLNSEEKVKYLSLIGVGDPAWEHLIEWVITFTGSVTIAKQSLVQGGKTEKEAEDILDQINDPEKIRDAAMEAIRHPYRPSRRNIKEVPSDSPKQ